MKLSRIVFAIILITALLLSVVQVVPQFGQTGQASASTKKAYTISIDASWHDNYGFTYPLTYEFSIPAALTNAKLYHKHNSGDSWVQLTSQSSANATTPSNFYNGNESARWDYTNDKVYVNVAFSSTSDKLYVEVTDSSDVVQDIEYAGMPTYWDGRAAAVTLTGDGWCNPACSDTYCPERPEAWPDLVDTWQSHHVWGTIGVDTNNGGQPDWSEIQSQINEGYLEVASQGITHGYPNSWTETTSNTEISGSKASILGNLTLPWFQVSGSVEYVFSWLAPHGQITNFDKTHFGEYHYLISRWYELDCGAIDYQTWDYTHNTFTPTGITIWAQNVGLCASTDTDDLNSEFDAAYSAGGIYYLSTHPDLAGNLTDSNGWYNLHLEHINDYKDIWYAPFGILYLYQLAATVPNILSVGGLLEDYPTAIDNYLNENAQTTNYGTSTSLLVTTNISTFRERALLQFDLSSIEEGIALNNATLKMYYWGHDSSDPVGEYVFAYKLTKSTWSETTSTWIKYTDTAILRQDWTSILPGSSGVAANYGYIRKIQASSTGSVNYIKINAKANGNVKVAVYDDDGTSGEPYTLLGVQNTSKAVSAGTNWIPLETEFTVTNGDYYYVGILNDSTNGCTYWTYSGLTTRYKSITYANGFPSTWDNGGDTHSSTVVLDCDPYWLEYWDTAGGDYVTSNPDGGNATIPAAAGWIVIDVTDIAQDAIDNENGLLNILIRSDEDQTVSSAIKFYSREYATASYRPYVSIDGTYPSISLSPISKTFNDLIGNESYYGVTDISDPSWPIGDGNCTFTITNMSAITIDILVKSGNFTGGTGWTLGTPGNNTARLKLWESGAANEGAGLVPTASYQTLISDLPAGNSTKVEIRLDTPTTINDQMDKTATVTFLPTQPDLMSGGEESEQQVIVKALLYIDISNTPSSWNINSGNAVTVGNVYSTGLDNFTLSNDGNITVDIAISGTDLVQPVTGYTWYLNDSGEPSAGNYSLKAGLNGNLTYLGNWTGTASQSRNYAVCANGTFIYTGTDTNPTVIVKIAVGNMSTVSSATADSGLKYSRQMIYLDGFVYDVLETNPAKVLKIDAGNLSISTFWTGNASQINGEALIWDGTYLVVACSSGHVIQINRSTGATVNSIALSRTYYGLGYDDSYYYAASWSTHAKLDKISRSTMSLDSTWTGAAGEDSASSVTVIGTHAYVGLYTDPGQVIDVGTATMTTSDTWTGTADQEYVTHVVDDGHYIYASTDTYGPGITMVINSSGMDTVASFGASFDSVVSICFYNGLIITGYCESNGAVIKTSAYPVIIKKESPEYLIESLEPDDSLAWGMIFISPTSYTNPSSATQLSGNITLTASVST